MTPLETLAHLAHEAATETDRGRRREVLGEMAVLLDGIIKADGPLTNCNTCAHDRRDEDGLPVCHALRGGTDAGNAPLRAWIEPNTDHHGYPLPTATNCPTHKPRA